jgi:hypothetical protein
MNTVCNDYIGVVYHKDHLKFILRVMSLKLILGRIVHIAFV